MKSEQSHLFLPLLFVIVLIQFSLIFTGSYQRIQFPFDALNWSETPAIVNLEKLSMGDDIHTFPGNANSFVYPGRSEVAISSITGRPFPILADLKILRISAFLAVILGSLCWLIVFKSLYIDEITRCQKLLMAIIIFSLPVIINHQSLLSESPHPDSFTFLFVSTVAILSYLSLKKGSLVLFCLSAIIAAFGLWVKQSSLLILLAPLMLSFMWQTDKLKLISALSVMAVILSTIIYFSNEHRVFWTIDLLESHMWTFKRFNKVLFDRFHFNFLLLISFFSAVFIAVLVKKNSSLKKPELAFLITVILGLGPIIVGAGKIGGSKNSFIMGLELPLLAFTLYLMLYFRHRKQALKLCLMPILMIPPLKAVPTVEYLDYLTEIKADIENEIEQGHRVHLGHGRLLLPEKMRMQQIPSFQTVSVLELRVGDYAIEPAMINYLNTGVDVFYKINAKWLGKEITTHINANFCKSKTFEVSLEDIDNYIVDNLFTQLGIPLRLYSYYPEHYTQRHMFKVDKYIKC